MLHLDTDSIGEVVSMVLNPGQIAHEYDSEALFVSTNK
jgi:hypothetical protein